MGLDRLSFRLRAFEQIRRLPATGELLFGEAESLARDCGDGYLAVRGRGRTRDRAAVLTVTGKAVRDNARNNTLVCKLGGRGR